jgi:hypothetical protein
MNNADITDDYDDYNVEALEREAEELRDNNSAGLDHVRVAQREGDLSRAEGELA